MAATIDYADVLSRVPGKVAKISMVPLALRFLGVPAPLENLILKPQPISLLGWQVHMRHC